MPHKILVVDDEAEIADLIETYLAEEDYTIFKFYSARDALACIETTDLDLAILDVMLPDKEEASTGYYLCSFSPGGYVYFILLVYCTKQGTYK